MSLHTNGKCKFPWWTTKIYESWSWLIVLDWFNDCMWPAEQQKYCEGMNRSTNGQTNRWTDCQLVLPILLSIIWMIWELCSKKVVNDLVQYLSHSVFKSFKVFLRHTNSGCFSIIFSNSRWFHVTFIAYKIWNIKDEEHTLYFDIHFNYYIM